MLTLHHLDYSRSTRVLWLLEELELPYRLLRYARAVGGPAPEALKALHPLGKSPVIEDDGLVLTESSAILRYIDARHGGSRFTPQNALERAKHDEWLDYVEGSLAMPLFVPLVAGHALPEPMRDGFAAQLEKAWAFIGTALEGHDFLMGAQPTLADMQLSYVVSVAASTGALRHHAAIKDYLGRLMARPALVRAIKAGGPMAA